MTHEIDMILLPLLHVKAGTTVVRHIAIYTDICDLLFLGKPGASITCSVGGSRGCRNVLVVEK